MYYAIFGGWEKKNIRINKILMKKARMAHTEKTEGHQN